MRSASFQTGEARRALSTSGLTSTATTRPCRVIATSSPLSTRSSWAGRVSRAVLALIVGIANCTLTYDTGQSATGVDCGRVAVRAMLNEPDFAIQRHRRDPTRGKALQLFSAWRGTDPDTRSASRSAVVGGLLYTVLFRFAWGGKERRDRR